MARPERKTVDYFPHYISDGKKMFYIEHKYGNDGYSTWFKILESLASTDDHFLNLNDQMDVLFLSAKCRVEESVLISILNDLSMLGEIDVFLWKNKLVYSHKFIESIQDAYSRRSNKCMNYESFCIHYKGLCTTITRETFEKEYNNPQSKVKYSKVEKSKVNVIAEKSKKFFPPTLKEVSDYCLERNNLHLVDPSRFIDHYTSNGWMVGKTKMKDWKAAIRTWEKNSLQKTPQNGNTTSTTQSSGSRQTLGSRMDEAKRRAAERRNQQVKSEGTIDDSFVNYQDVTEF